MQEEIESRTVTLLINTGKTAARFTERMLKEAISKYLAHCKEAKHQKQLDKANPVTPHGKQTVKQLVEQNQGVSNIEIKDSSIRDFDRIARKYGVDYAIKRDRGSDPPRFLVFFKGRDADALTAAFQEYAGKKVKKATRPSVLQKLARFKAMIKKPVMDREKRKEQTR